LTSSPHEGGQLHAKAGSLPQKEARHPLNGSLKESHNRPGRCGRKKNRFLCRETNPAQPLTWPRDD